MPHPAKESEPANRKVLKRSVRGPNKAFTKKNGAGGKGTWGVAGKGDSMTTYALDRGDPNYDSGDEMGSVVLEAY